MRSKFFLLATLASSSPLAETGPVTAEATAVADIQSAACEQAFLEAREKALLEMDADFIRQTPSQSQQVELRSRTDERLGKNEAGQFQCRVTGTWAAIPLPREKTEEPSPLFGSIETIEGRYQANCKAADNRAICREKIENQARVDLLDQLAARSDITRGEIRLHADGFEGTQSYTYQGKDLTLTMDGVFYFAVRKPTKQSQPEAGPPTGTEGEIRLKKDRIDQSEAFSDRLDFTVSFTWDRNDGADPNELAISNNRWGLGLWVDNRFGFSAFWGEEEVGIADSEGFVHNDGGIYDIHGIGIGYRVFDSRVVTLENMLHFVDAQPFSTTVAPGCSGCSPRQYKADDYYQASINLKTNTHGLNIGWILTWKLRDDLSNHDSLSGGWYLELQF